MDRRPIRAVPRRALAGVVLAAIAVVSFAASAALAGHMRDWSHDHSSDAIPPRPSGLTELNIMFGQRCIDRSNDSRSYWPHQSDAGAGYIYYNSYIARNVGYNIRKHIDAVHRDGALYPGIGGYNCRLISGSTSWSSHSWGAAIDTNWQRNPMGQNFWNGRGADGHNYGTYIPDVWRGPSPPGHRFFWGLNWDSRPDPMHFQYVTDY